MPAKPPHITRFLSHHRAAAALLAGVERDARLLQATRRLLPEELAPHCLHASLEGERLCLLTDGPVWASRLRFSVPQVLAGLAVGFPSTREVRIRISPASADRQLPATDNCRVALSEETIAHLRQTAASIDDPELAAAFLRLAESGARSRSDRGSNWGSRQVTARGRGE